MSFNILQGCQEYAKTMIERVGGMKALILDSETTAIISLLYSQSQILEREVFLVEKIGNETTERHRHLKAIYFIRPTPENFLILAKELKDPHYGDYHIFFSNVVPQGQLERLARCDTLELVQEVQEYYSDVYAINADLFSLNLPNTSTLTLSSWTSFEEKCMSRIVDGLFATTLTLQRRPVIRYLKSSVVCTRIAQALHSRMMSERSLYNSCSRGGESPDAQQCVLLISDRREDPITPLLNQWTYQAMLHELLGIQRNRVSLKDVPGIKKEMEETLLSPEHDKFYKQNLNVNFGDLSNNVTKFLEEHDAFIQKFQTQMQSVPDMQKIMENFPEFRKMKQSVEKHVTIAHELNRLINQYQLFKVSALEQELVTSDKKVAHCERIFQLLRSSIPPYEKLRLVLLYSIRHESDSKIASMKQLLMESGVSETQISLIDTLTKYSGASVRSGDLFSSKSIISSITKTLATSDNIYTQHQTLLSDWVSQLLKGKLKESLFPFMSNLPANTVANLARERAGEVIAFVTGGVSYEESRDIAILKQNSVANGGKEAKIILGGTDIINSRSFLADVAQLKKRWDGSKGHSVQPMFDGEINSIGHNHYIQHEDDLLA